MQGSDKRLFDEITLLELVLNLVLDPVRLEKNAQIQDTHTLTRTYPFNAESLNFYFKALLRM